MNGLAMTVAVGSDFLQQDSNLKIARREEMFLNAAVDLSCSQPSHRELPASAGGLKS